MKNTSMVEIPEETYEELLQIEQKYLCIMKKFEEVLKNSSEEGKFLELFELLYRCHIKKLEKVFGKNFLTFLENLFQ